ncbi:tyrosine-type recombinase/integrase [Amycolatopsis sp. NPDC004079]|uniref:tyrosine-type recombinase/integrase n=1 Tax=Amycolatopsis sp. NPDC004079 TaxID=3154549 RepID=UPI0033B95AC2
MNAAVLIAVGAGVAVVLWVPAKLVRALASIAETLGSLALLKRRWAEARKDGRSLASPVFASTVGGLRDPNNVLRVIREIRGGDEFIWLTSHNFRKTTATAMDDAGIPTRLIADHLGHSRVSMTQDNYLERKAVDPVTALALEGLLDNPSPLKTGELILTGCEQRAADLEV